MLRDGRQRPSETPIDRDGQVLVTVTRCLRNTIVQKLGDDVGTRFPEVDRQPAVNSAVKH